MPRLHLKSHPAWFSWVARLSFGCLLMVVIASVASACPTCKQALVENDPQQQSIVSGYFYSILFMMSAPFAILSTLGGLAFVTIRRANKEASESAEP